MSAFTGGGHGKGAMRLHLATKRDEATARDAALKLSSLKRRRNRLEDRAVADRLTEARLVRLSDALGVDQ